MSYRRKTLAELLAEAKKQRAEITQLFVDCEHWNDCVRKPDEERIEADPLGDMRRIAAALDAYIKKVEERL